ncbi:hypothetical protein LG634_30585 [Streptomyces bambusae]|uniref:hypothetical protein n=1 Tax=Streptomyces bambusae TaxID=1550616 RepID=UPI001CFF98B3|nr:hypothetical protein [Streptomyces bambusae]MCB5169142.1 hypothetical protein [Streptomyces bambusae]
MTPEPTVTLPPVAPAVLAEAVEGLTGRLRKKLDAAIADCAGSAVSAPDGSFAVRFGEDTVVTLRPAASGAVTAADQAVCGCLLAPRCLHRAAVLGAAPIADLPAAGAEDPFQEEPAAESAPVGPDAGAAHAGAAAEARPATHGDAEESLTGTPEPLTDAQRTAAGALWQAAATALAGGVSASGAVVQAELLRAAHSARVAGLPRAEAAALRLVRGLRAARDRSSTQRLSDLTAAFRELLRISAVLAAGTADPDLSGGTRRAYRPGGSLRAYGLCREPVLSATGYGGVVTHLLTPDGLPLSVSDVKPGGLARARGAGSASVAIGGAVLDHAGLARGGLLVVGATVSADGRLGAGRGVKATPLRGIPWTEEPAAALFARPAAEAVTARQADAAADGRSGLLGCDVEVTGAAGDHLLVRELSPDGTVRDGAPFLRLVPAHPHPELPYVANLRRLAGCPGLRLRVIGRPDLDRAATLRAVSVGPVPGAADTLRLPAEWLGRVDLGYDRIQGEHLPAGTPGPVPRAVDPGPDLLADSPLWRVRRLLETGVAGGRRAVAEAARGGEPVSRPDLLRRAGFGTAADLADALAAEADCRTRDAFGRLTDTSTDRYAHAWLASSVHLAASERALITASWS